MDGKKRKKTWEEFQETAANGMVLKSLLLPAPADLLLHCYQLRKRGYGENWELGLSKGDLIELVLTKLRAKEGQDSSELLEARQITKLSRRPYLPERRRTSSLFASSWGRRWHHCKARLAAFTFCLAFSPVPCFLNPAIRSRTLTNTYLFTSSRSSCIQTILKVH